MEKNNVAHQNNFDFIRLFAALQVLLLHHVAFFDLKEGHLFKVIERAIWNFPGVNVFFIISGYLIIQSIERNSTKVFVRKRLKRIYPALIVCFFFTVVLLALFESPAITKMFSFEFLKWLIAQLTIFQFYNPDMVRDFGFSPPNGALWTISVELQFYILIACFGYWFLAKQKRTKNLILLLVFSLSAMFNHVFNTYLSPDGLVYKLSFVFVLSYLYFFVAGIFIYTNRDFFIEKLRGKAIIWCAAFVLTSVLLDGLGIRYHRYTFNGLSLFMLLLLVGLVFSLAYSNMTLSRRILRGNDISYGIYIYQMPVINLFFHLKLNTSLSQFLLSLSICITMGILSWFLIEKKALGR